MEPAKKAVKRMVMGSSGSQVNDVPSSVEPEMNQARLRLYDPSVDFLQRHRGHPKY